MKFLVDVQLPVALARFLVAQGHDAIHVSDIADPCTPDRALWDIAAEKGLTVITKDEDFVGLAKTKQTRVLVLWLRCGNIANSKLLALIDRSLPRAIASFASGRERVILR